MVVEQTSPEETGLVADAIVREEMERQHIGISHDGFLFRLFKNHIPIIIILRTINAFLDFIKCSVFVQIIAGIEKKQVIARRRLDAFVHRVVNSFVGFADPVRDFTGVLFDDCFAVVLAATVDDNVLEILPGLTEQTFYRLRQAFGIVVIDGDDGNLFRHGLYVDEFIGIHFGDAFREFDGVFPAEAVEFGRIGKFARRPVGFGRVEYNFAFKTDDVFDQISQIFN